MEIKKIIIGCVLTLTTSMAIASPNENEFTLESRFYAKNYGGSELDTTIETSDINWNIFSIDKIVVTNHTLEIGVYSVAGANDWCNLDLAMLRKID